MATVLHIFLFSLNFKITNINLAVFKTAAWISSKHTRKQAFRQLVHQARSFSFAFLLPFFFGPTPLLFFALLIPAPDLLLAPFFSPVLALGVLMGRASA